MRFFCKRNHLYSPGSESLGFFSLTSEHKKVQVLFMQEVVI